MGVIDQLLLLFARSIFAKVNALSWPGLTPHQCDRLRRSITEDIRNGGGVLIPDVIPPEVSRAAQQEADRIGVNLFTKHWHNQPAFDPGRKTFHWEHVHPVSAIQERCKKAKSEEEVLNMLKTCLRVAWILKREDEELTRLGYRSKRDDPDAAYRAARIELLKCHDITPARSLPAKV